MRKIVYLFLLVVAITGLQACTDDTIGGSLIDTRTTIIQDSSFIIKGSSIRNQRIQARTATQLLGVLHSKGYGTLSSEVVTQFMPSTMIDTLGVTADMIDSCKLVLRIPSNGFTGDAETPMRLSVYKLNKQLTSPLFSDFDPTGYYSTSDLLGTAPYSPQSATTAYDTQNSQNSTEYLETYVPMPVALAKDIFNEFKRNPETFSTPTAFAKFFPGIIITNTFGSGRVMNFANTEFKVFYRKHTTTLEGADSIAEGQERVYMAASPEVLSNNIINLNIDTELQSRIAAGEAIVMAPAGYEVRMNFPIQDIIDHYKQGAEGGLTSINNVTLTLPVEQVTNANKIAPPKYLLMVKTSKKDQFIAGDSLTNNKDSFYATYDSSNKCYTFTGLRAYVLNIINNQDAVATDDDSDITITPVDVNTYTTSSSYYTTSTTTVTKISPMVSAPAIARLRLDKAKVKINYSKQVVM
ncbi:MAG: DUF4270 family protein [Muribaculaceae bacterium]|nr:DUF4270 family protein [Muribaculaceae bacterium]